MDNRNAEFERLLDELGAEDERAAGTVERARARLRRRRMVTRPAGMLAAVFVCFVALVNFCAPVAEACSGVPGLRELARAVTFSRSLSDAVDNEYVQPIELVQADGDVTATVEYLIVDQKQVTVFFRLDSEAYECLAVDPEFRDAYGEDNLLPCSYYSNDFDVPIGQLQSVTIDFVYGDVPDKLRMLLKVQDVGSWYKSAPAAPADLWAEPEDRPGPEYVANFDFLLEFDPWFTQQGKYFEVNQVMELDGQKIIIRDMEVYPSHLRLNVEDVEENSAWLKGLEFRIEADGEVFDTVRNGISATGVLDSPMMTSYRADSTFFYDAKELKVVVTAATWLSKDMERIHVDLANGVADAMPEGAELVGAKYDGKRWVVTVGCGMRGWDGDETHHSMHQVFLGNYYDAQGNEFHINSWSSGSATMEFEERPGYFYEEFPLQDYPYDEVWLSPHYSSYWVAEEPVSITINLD